MFTRYDYKAGSLAANVVNDIVKLLTGTTDKATLSASCVQATTVIINDGVTRPAGWELWDAAAGTNMQSIRALNFDGVTYKYANIAHNNATWLNLRCYESWNATTHVGTNLANNSEFPANNYAASLNLAAGGSLFISASARGIVFIGFVSGVYDNCFPIIMEHSRDEPWDTPALNIPPYGWMQSTSMNGSIFKPRRKYTSVSDATGTNGAVNCSNIYGGQGPLAKVRDALNNPVHVFCPIMLTFNSTSSDPQVLGKLFDIFLTTVLYGTSGDETSFNGNTYFIAASTNFRIAIPKF